MESHGIIHARAQYSQERLQLQIKRPLKQNAGEKSSHVNAAKLPSRSQVTPSHVVVAVTVIAGAPVLTVRPALFLLKPPV